jgi:hypothetical protein
LCLAIAHNQARSRANTFFKPRSSDHFTIITLHGLCSLTRSLVLPSMNRAIRECPAAASALSLAGEPSMATTIFGNTVHLASFTGHQAVVR